MNRLRCFTIALALLAACAPVRPAPARPRAEQYASDVQFLAANAQHGRGVATAGISRAADYIARTLAAQGLRPAFGASYYQHFTASVGAAPGPRTFLSVGGVELPRDKYQVFGLSSPGTFEAQVVFAGYGISAPELGYDDYAGVDVRGKVVVVLRYEPQETDPASRFDGTQWSEYATFRYKIFNAHRHGAAAVLLVTGPKVHGAKSDELVPMQSDPLAGQGFGLPMFHVARSALEPLLTAAGVDLAAFQDAVDLDLEPRSRVLDMWSAGWADITRFSFDVANVGALLPGRDASRTIVFGAHYDHLGFGGPYAVSGSTEAIYHGADDNASGTAGLLALARWYAAGPQPPVNLLFIAFSAEESGLVGSTYFVQHAENLDTTALMLNMDMIGRLRGGALTVFGGGTAAELDELVALATPPGISVIRKPEGFGPSDHAPFYCSGVPVLHFFTGSHDDYHTTHDTDDKINVAGGLAVVEMVKGVADRAAGLPKLTYRGPDRPVALFVGEEAGPGAPWLGVRPSFAAAATGAVVGAVLMGSPAADALKPGDQIVALDGEPVANFYELTHFLRAKRPGDRARLAVMRGRRLTTIELRLGARK